jgi:hypothetical protein
MATTMTGFMAQRFGYLTAAGQPVQWTSSAQILEFSGRSVYLGNFAPVIGSYYGLRAVPYPVYPSMVGNQAARNAWRYVQLGKFNTPYNIYPGTNLTFTWSFKFEQFGTYLPSAFEFAVVYLPPGVTDVTSGTTVATQVINVTTTPTTLPPLNYNSITTGPFANPYVGASTSAALPSGVAGGSSFAVVLQRSSAFTGDVPDTFYIGGAIGVDISTINYTAIVGGSTRLFSSQRPVVFNPQNVAQPTWITSYDWFATQINATYKQIQDDLNGQVISAYGLRTGFAYGLRYRVPRLSYDPPSGLFAFNLPVPDGIGWSSASPSSTDTALFSFDLSNGDSIALSPSAVDTGPLQANQYEEAWAFTMNTALAQLIPFSVSRNADNDSNAIDASALQLEWKGGVFNGSKKLTLSQEFVSTAAWNPFVGLAITSNSIPAQYETSGQTVIFSGQAPVPQIGNTTNPILFDLDFSTTNAHSLIQGLSFAPFIYRWVQMSGGPLSDIGFFVYLKTRDNTLVPWDVPAFGMIDIKFLFSQSRLGITV